MKIQQYKQRKFKANLSSEQNQTLLSFAKLDSKDVLNRLKTSDNGLKLKDIESLREKCGYNIFSTKKKHGVWIKIINAFLNPFSAILAVIAMSIVLTPIFASKQIEASNWISFVIISSMIILSGAIKLFQEGRSSKASEKLKQMIKTTTAIKRNDVIKELPIEEVLPGDIIKLSAGDMIPADIRIITAKDLFITQSSLTGESEPVEKFSSPFIGNTNSALECNNICFMGTSVSSGSAVGVAINTGKNTFLGSIAKILNRKIPKSSFDIGIASVSWILIWTMLVMALIVFVIYGCVNFLKYNDTKQWINALTYTLAVAVGLTPEMLPMIVTLNLAKEAFKLSKQETIVKNINSIQSFGAMDVLCTDKTGTLTEDKIVLERHINLAGDDDNRVLSFAFINSYYQTGLKNLIDLAVIEKADKIGIDDPIMGFKKVDEIPFDFKRKRMSVIIEDNQNKRLLVTKGAFEEIIEICDYCEYKGETLKLNSQLKKRAFKIVNNLNQDGMRVIAVAINHDILSTNRPFITSDEKHMCLIGFIALLDPPKESAFDAIKALRNHGVTVKVLTGDNDIITRYVCKTVGIDSENILLGSDINNMSDEELRNIVMDVNIFAKLSPEQKSRIVLAIKSNKHVVGYMGDGINDAAAMQVADIGISVDTAVDIAKESADIILLKKDLRILKHGVVEGRKTFCNIIKYIKMTISSNFGNMLSVLFAAIWLSFVISPITSPSAFTPMVAIHILILNIIYDFSQYSIPWDNVDENYIKFARQWNPKSIFKFMVCIGPVSTIFDIASFMIMFYLFGWNSSEFQNQFSTGWFLESLLTQITVIYVLRTEKIPFIQSNPVPLVNLSLLIIFLFGLILTLIPNLDGAYFTTLVENQPIWILYSFLLTFAYMFVAQGAKKLYIHIFNEWL
ncbi:MAG: magnesium-translocating P-type ATPase [Mycoplasma sp.]|nr:magnesium-translocating P-type ATPase [Mycoplasma sp.]